MLSPPKVQDIIHRQVKGRGICAELPAEKVQSKNLITCPSES